MPSNQPHTSFAPIASTRRLPNAGSIQRRTLNAYDARVSGFQRSVQSARNAGANVRTVRMVADAALSHSTASRPSGGVKARALVSVIFVPFAMVRSLPFRFGRDRRGTGAPIVGEHPGHAGQQRQVRVCADARLDSLRLHDLRHSHASHAVMNGESLHITGRLLGHRRASTTNRYVHLDDATLNRAAERVDLAMQDSKETVPP